MSRCYCEECTRLDKLPVRKQGWPGCFQMLLPTGVPLDSYIMPEVEPYQPQGPSYRQQQTADDLPLFGGGSDEPYLL